MKFCQNFDESFAGQILGKFRRPSSTPPAPTKRTCEKLYILHLEFKAVIVLPAITHNHGNYLYGNYVGNAPVGTWIPKHVIVMT